MTKQDRKTRRRAINDQLAADDARLPTQLDIWDQRPPRPEVPVPTPAVPAAALA